MSPDQEALLWLNVLLSLKVFATVRRQHSMRTLSYMRCNPNTSLISVVTEHRGVLLGCA
jgi:hypothetical protein